MFVDYFKSPLGLIEIKATQQGICQVIFSGEQRSTPHKSDLTELCKQQLHDYFEGGVKYFDLPLDPQGTPFQRSVWKALEQIPFGETQSYQTIADVIQNPKAVRAVGGANGRNPISIIVPCHRVIGRNGTLTGYAGGVERKRWLLTHEGVDIKPSKVNDVLTLQEVILSRQAKTQFLK